MMIHRHRTPVTMSTLITLSLSAVLVMLATRWVLKT